MKYDEKTHKIQFLYKLYKTNAIDHIPKYK